MKLSDYLDIHPDVDTAGLMHGERAITRSCKLINAEVGQMDFAVRGNKPGRPDQRANVEQLILDAFQ